MSYSSEDINKKGVIKKPENTRFFNKLKMKKVLIRQLDDTFHELHDEVFDKIDCMDCANCCKTTSPIFKMSDIDKLAKSMKIKSLDFIDKYLYTDKDGDYVLQSTPCPFLSDDNYCLVYDHRPLSCQEYPYTNRKNVFQILDITLANTLICPATYEIVEKLKKIVEPKLSYNETKLPPMSYKPKKK